MKKEIRAENRGVWDNEVFYDLKQTHKGHHFGIEDAFFDASAVLSAFPELGVERVTLDATNCLALNFCGGHLTIFVQSGTHNHDYDRICIPAKFESLFLAAIKYYNEFFAVEDIEDNSKFKLGVDIKENVINAIVGERRYQNRKWGTIQQHPLEVGSYLVVLDNLLADAKKAFGREQGNHAALVEIRKIAAVAVACMEQHGAPERNPRLKR